MAKKPPSNPLIAGGAAGFSLADSFGITATLPAVAVANAEEDSFVGGGGAAAAGPAMQPPASPWLGAPAPATSGTPSMFSSPMSFFSSSPAVGASTDDPFSGISSQQQQPAPATTSTSPQSVSLSCPPGPASPPPPLQTPMPAPVPSLMVQGATPQPATPGPPQQLFMAPPVAAVSPSAAPVSTIKRPTYAPTPFLTNPPSTATAAPSPSLASIPGLPPLPEPKTIQHVATPSATPSAPYLPPPGGHLPPSQSAPNLSAMSQSPVYSGAAEMTSYHWFYRLAGDQEVWKPFSVEDSTAIDMAHEAGRRNEPIQVDGTRYDVYIDRRVKVPVYWPGKELTIRRCSWFHRHDPEGRWIPYDEATAEKLETEFLSARGSGRWQVKVVFESGEWVMLHSPEVMMHFPSSSASVHGALDDWGQVQPQTDPALRPQVVHRGLDGLPDIPDGEAEEVDHLFFVVHGIGAACDIKFRPLEEVVDGFRELSADMSEKHFAGAHLASKANRVEFLPVHWHDKVQ